MKKLLHITFLIVITSLVVGCSDDPENQTAGANANSETSFETSSETSSEATVDMSRISKKLEEGYTLSAMARLAVLEYYQTNGKLPNNIYKAGLIEKTRGGPRTLKLVGQLTPKITLYVRGSGVIQLSYKRSDLGLDSSYPDYVAQRISPTVMSDNTLSWSCSVEGRLFSKYADSLPDSCNEFY